MTTLRTAVQLFILYKELDPRLRTLLSGKKFIDLVKLRHAVCLVEF